MNNNKLISFLERNQYLYIVFPIIFGAIVFYYGNWKEKKEIEKIHNEIINYGVKSYGYFTKFSSGYKGNDYYKYVYFIKGKKIEHRISLTKLPFRFETVKDCSGYKFEVIYSSRNPNICEPHFDKPIK